MTAELMAAIFGDCNVCRHAPELHGEGGCGVAYKSGMPCPCPSEGDAA